MMTHAEGYVHNIHIYIYIYRNATRDFSQGKAVNLRNGIRRLG